VPFSVVQASVLLSLYFVEPDSFVQFSYYASLAIVAGVIASFRCEYWENSVDTIGNYIGLVCLIATAFEIAVWFFSGYHFFGILMASNALQGYANKLLYSRERRWDVVLLCVLSIMPYLVFRTVSSAAFSTGLPVLFFAIHQSAGQWRYAGFWEGAFRSFQRNFLADRPLQLNWSSAVIAIVNQNWLPLQGLFFLQSEFLAPMLFFWRSANFIPMFLSKPWSWKVYFHAKSDTLNPTLSLTLVGGALVSMTAAVSIYLLFLQEERSISSVLVMLVVAGVVARFASNLLTHALAFSRKLAIGLVIQAAFLVLLVANALAVSDELLNYQVFVAIQLVISTIVAYYFFYLYTRSPRDVL
tara:strand:- start:1060 stop:2127 length:1068 start_codon:yes stop_codon:yes gene_type:complete